ncbi:hypothetical protein AURDEDRAFT_165821 [Auricularia subglabra TFB-10046 SS5]|nr:hypothetical protein AURDEDRAFT_165821 [Auricularia subglabra TFB-10046 SS5]
MRRAVVFAQKQLMPSLCVPLLPAWPIDASHCLDLFGAGLPLRLARDGSPSLGPPPSVPRPAPSEQRPAVPLPRTFELVHAISTLGLGAEDALVLVLAARSPALTALPTSLADAAIKELATAVIYDLTPPISTQPPGGVPPFAGAHPQTRFLSAIIPALAADVDLIAFARRMSSFVGVKPAPVDAVVSGAPQDQRLSLSSPLFPSRTMDVKLRQRINIIPAEVVAPDGRCPLSPSPTLSVVEDVRASKAAVSSHWLGLAVNFEDFLRPLRCDHRPSSSPMRARSWFSAPSTLTSSVSLSSHSRPSRETEWVVSAGIELRHASLPRSSTTRLSSVVVVVKSNPQSLLNLGAAHELVLAVVINGSSSSRGAQGEVTKFFSQALMGILAVVEDGQRAFILHLQRAYGHTRTLFTKPAVRVLIRHQHVILLMQLDFSLLLVTVSTTRSTSSSRPVNFAAQISSCVPITLEVPPTAALNILALQAGGHLLRLRIQYSASNVPAAQRNEPCTTDWTCTCWVLKRIIPLSHTSRRTLVAIQSAPETIRGMLVHPPAFYDETCKSCTHRVARLLTLGRRVEQTL